MKSKQFQQPRRPETFAFSLVELLASVAILSVILVLMAQILDATQKTWISTTGKIEQFQGARRGFDGITRRLAQATLNTYWDYDNYDNPTAYVRNSELRFISGPAESLLGTGTSARPTHAVFFQAPLGFTNQSDLQPLKNLLNTWGYWIEYSSDDESRPDFIRAVDTTIHGQSTARSRFRLMEMMEPTESMTLYENTNGMNASGTLPKSMDPIYLKKTDWFKISATKAGTSRPVWPLADNIIALILLPKLSPEEDPDGGLLAPEFKYDSTVAKSDARINSRNQLPPVVQVTMFAVDEASYSAIFPANSNIPDFNLSSLFKKATGTGDDAYPGSIEALKKTLKDKHLTYRVFTANVGIRAAKWSRDQAGSPETSLK